MSTALTLTDLTNSVAVTVREYVQACELQLPADYSVENALKSATLILQNMKVDKQPVAMVCSASSIKNSLLCMAVQGMNLDKKQGYFIAYGSSLAFQRSYFGNMALAKRLDNNIDEIYADVVYKGDTFEYSKVKGRTVIDIHKQTLNNIKREAIVAAYAIVIYKDGKENSTIMTFDEIVQAWKQSSGKPFDDKGVLKSDSVHYKFTAEMCKKTVTSKACKPIINSSDDSNLVVKFAKQSDDDSAIAEVEEEVTENANKIPFDVSDVPEAHDVEFKDVEGKEADPF